MTKEQKIQKNMKSHRPENISENSAQQDEHSQSHQDGAENSPAADELEKLREENQKLKDSFLRAYAEAENTKKRCQQEIEKNSKFAISSFAKELLAVADDLQRAVDAVKENADGQCASLLQGVEMTRKELSSVFEKFGIKKIDSLGRVFDPNFERVVQEIEDTDKPAGTVVSELQSAYTLNDRILREAMVIVTKGGK